MKLRFGKYKGQEFENTPKSYQDWLLKQDWFKAPKVQKYVVIEGGCSTHTSDLTLQEAKDTVEEMSKMFEDVQWHYEPMNEYNKTEAKGIMERQRDTAVRYFQP